MVINSSTENDAGRYSTIRSSVRIFEAYAEPSGTACPRRNSSDRFSQKYVLQVHCQLFSSGNAASFTFWVFGRSKEIAERDASMQTMLPMYFTSAAEKNTVERCSSDITHACKYADRDLPCSFGFLLRYSTRMFSFMIYSDATFSSKSACRLVPPGNAAAGLSLKNPNLFPDHLFHLSRHLRPSKCLPFPLLYFLKPKPVPFENGLGASPGLR